MQVNILGRQDFTIFDYLEEMGIDAVIGRIDPPAFAEEQVGSEGQKFYTRGLIQTRDDLDLMQFPDNDDPEICRLIEDLVKQNRIDVAVGPRLRLGVSYTFISMGMEALSFALVDDPSLVRDVFERYVDWTIPIIRRLPETGCDYITNSDDIAYKNGPMVSPVTFRSTFMPGLRRIADAIHETDLPWVYHSDGDLTPIMDDLISLGMQAIHPFEPGAMDIEECKRLYGDRLCMYGNIDLHYTLTRGTPEEVREEVCRRIEVLGRGGGYVISSANSLTYYCKIENVLAMRDAIREFGRYA